MMSQKKDTVNQLSNATVSHNKRMSASSIDT